MQVAKIDCLSYIALIINHIAIFFEKKIIMFVSSSQKIINEVMETKCIHKMDLTNLLQYHFPDHNTGNMDLMYQEIIENKIQKETLINCCKQIVHHIPIIDKYVNDPTRVNILKYGLDCFFKTGWNGNDLSESRMKVIYEVLKYHLLIKYKNQKINKKQQLKQQYKWLLNQRAVSNYYSSSDISLERSIVKKLVNINILEAIYSL